MPLVAAKCTQCGANIEVDDTKEAGICKYCGTAFITEKAITNYNTYITNNYTTNNNYAGASVTVVSTDISGLLEDAKKELVLHNFKNANIYLDEIKKTGKNTLQTISNLFREVGVLEYAKETWRKDPESKETKEVLDEIMAYDSQNADVWLFMIETNFWAKDIISYGKKAIVSAPDDQKTYYENKVYTLYIEKEFDGKRAVSVESIIDEIPASAFMNNTSLNSLLYNKCKEFINENKNIIGSYTDRINSFAEKLQPEQKESIQSLLYPREYKQNISEKNNKSGCYIATCIYGSYDCPQVWTLRRFRDYTLDETWYGRLFIKCYYVISPTLVKWFGQTKWFRNFWKGRLDKMVSELNDKGVDNTYYHDKY